MIAIWQRLKMIPVNLFLMAFDLYVCSNLQHMHAEHGVHNADLQLFAFHDWPLFDVKFQRHLNLVEIHRQPLPKGSLIPAAELLQMFQQTC